MSGRRIWLGFLIGAVAALAGVGVAMSTIILVHPGGAARQFSAFGCGFEIQFNGTTLDDKDTPTTGDDEYTWSYTVTRLDGPGCGLSHWVLALCGNVPNTYLGSGPPPSFLVIDDPGTTGLTGVKWNDIGDGFVMGTFTLTLSWDFPLDPDVDVGFKTGVGVVAGTIEGPACVVGGVAEFMDTGQPGVQGTDPSGDEPWSSAGVLAGVATVAAVAIAMASAALYARRRWMQ